MESFARGSDGRRLFTREFKREQIGRVLHGEKTLAELSRELGIKRTVLTRWRHLIEKGGETAVRANEDVVPASKLREAEQRIRELERALGRKTMEVEIVLITFDSDPAGRQGVARVAEQLSRHACTRGLSRPNTLDPASLKPKHLKQLLKQAGFTVTEGSRTLDFDTHGFETE